MQGNGLSRQDNVREYDASVVGHSGIIYIDNSNGDLYTWNGTAYVASTDTANELSEILANGNTTGGTNIDFEDDKALFGDNTEISEVSGDTVIENTTATNHILLKLNDFAGTTSVQIKNFLGTVINEFFSNGTHVDGDTTEDSINEFKNGFGDTLVKINTSDTAPATFENNGSEIGAATHTATDYNPSALTQDRRIIFDNTDADRECVISNEDIAAGSLTKHRKFTIKDESGGAAVHRIRIAGESGTIDGQAYVDINAPYGYIHLYTNGTNLFRE